MDDICKEKNERAIRNKNEKKRRKDIFNDHQHIPKETRRRTLNKSKHRLAGRFF
jgi:hypothetical protein